uniref:Endo/exonuclease/phosphatase domain-containing protein n=1 Tax=Strongyloides papillosus TaxID=174720 RepID=A0A0N5C4V1_STREA
MQTSSSQDSKVEEVYDQMKEIMSGFKKLYPLSRNNIIIGGDFNAKIKCTIRRGKFSNSAHLENNERGTKPELWTESENLSITNRLVIKKTSNEKKKRDQAILNSALKKIHAMKFVYIEKREFNHLNLSLLKPDGSLTTTIDEVNEEIKRHYKDLYTGLPLSNDWEKSVKNFETFKDFTLSHILQRIKKIRKKAPGTDGMSFAHYKLASNKPGSAKLITNTRPIAILQGDYKLFTSMLLDKIRNKIECNLDKEQGGFRQRKDTITGRNQ